MEGPWWDPLVESEQLINQTIKELESPIVWSFAWRLQLFLYCHVTEIDDVYSSVGNLLRISSGRRYSMAPFDGDWSESNLPAKSPVRKIERIQRWSEEVGIQEVGALFSEALVPEVRNAFFHSDYVLSGESFNIKNGPGPQIDGVMEKAVPLTWLEPKIQSAINIALVIIGLIRIYRSEYDSDRVVEAQFEGQEGPATQVVLLADVEQGLYGMRSANPEDLDGAV